MIQKQALAIAESLLEEITLQPFTYCDPDDPWPQQLPSKTADCAGAPRPLVTEAQSRYSGNAARFDNVSDYGSAARQCRRLPTCCCRLPGHPRPG